MTLAVLQLNINIIFMMKYFWICTVQISQAAAAYHNTITIKSLTYVYRSCIAGRATSRVSGRLKAMACALESSRI